MLESEYLGYKVNHRWICDKHHEWVATPSAIFSGSWCPHCLYKGERLVRECLSEIFLISFDKAWPKWLMRPTDKSRGLELDGFAPDIRLAFEYQGPQHFKFFPRWHESQEDFEDQKKRDAWKLKKCHEQDVILLRIKELKLINRKYAMRAIRAQLRSVEVTDKIETMWCSYLKNHPEWKDRQKKKKGP